MIAHYTNCFFLFISDHLKALPLFCGLVVSLSVETIIFKMIFTALSLLVAQIFAHYMKPFIIKKINRCKKKIQDKRNEIK